MSGKTVGRVEGKNKNTNKTNVSYKGYNKLLLINMGEK